MRWLTLLMLAITLLACNNSETAPAQTKAMPTATQSAVTTQQLVRDPSKPISSGQRQTIYIFADEDLWQAVEPAIRSSIERQFYTTENERLFDINWADIANIRTLNRFHNLLFICDVHSDLPVAQYVKTIMSTQSIANAREKGATMYMNNNLWASDQLVFFFIGSGSTAIATYLTENRDTYFNILYNRLIARLMFQSRRTKAHKDAFFAEVPFRLTLPQNYVVYKKDIPSRFISFIWRSRNDQVRNPDKYISVYWERAEQNNITREWLLEKRKELAWEYYDEDEFTLADTTSGIKNFKGKECWFLLGKWQNQKYFMGGVFQTFAYYSQKQKVIYLIDTSVYYPAGEKMAFILELEGIANSLIEK